jgi:prepilin-type N-terminal cleavage/methylation domain-containing protein
MAKRSKGFTLIELAIVLTIIGLIAGVIFVSGGKLFQSSKTAKTISIINELSEGILQFKNTYKGLPGDLLVDGELSGVNATCRTGGSNAGDNNGVIDANESDCVIEHLFRAGLTKSDDVDAAGRKVLVSPFTPLVNSVRVMHPSVSGASAWPRNVPVVAVISGLPCDVVQEIDRKIDDNDLEDGRSQAIDADGDPYTCASGSTVPSFVVTL